MTDEQRKELIDGLTANAAGQAGQAWAGVDLEAASEAELLAYDRFRRLVQPAEKGVSCSCGRKHAFNFEAGQWRESGTPKASKLPATVAEFLDAGGGSQQDREAWQSVQQANRAHRNQVLEEITANFDDARRVAYWTGHENTPIAELEETLELLRLQRQSQQSQQQQRPTANYYGAQGGPAPAAANVPTLDVPTLEFKRRSVS